MLTLTGIGSLGFGLISLAHEWEFPLAAIPAVDDNGCGALYGLPPCAPGNGLDSQGLIWMAGGVALVFVGVGVLAWRRRRRGVAVACVLAVIVWLSLLMYAALFP